VNVYVLMWRRRKDHELRGEPRLEDIFSSRVSACKAMDDWVIGLKESIKRIGDAVSKIHTPVDTDPGLSRDGHTRMTRVDMVSGYYFEVFLYLREVKGSPLEALAEQAK